MPAAKCFFRLAGLVPSCVWWRATRSSAPVGSSTGDADCATVRGASAEPATPCDDGRHCATVRGAFAEPAAPLDDGRRASTLAAAPNARLPDFGQSTSPGQQNNHASADSRTQRWNALHSSLPRARTVACASSGPGGCNRSRTCAIWADMRARPDGRCGAKHASIRQALAA